MLNNDPRQILNGGHSFSPKGVYIIRGLWFFIPLIESYINTTLSFMWDNLKSLIFAEKNYEN